MPNKHPLCIYFDVDGTLVHTAGDRSEPDDVLTTRLREWRNQGAHLYCWSSRGADYARSTAKNLRIEECFVGFLTKPHVLVDDQGIKSWAYFLELAPGRAARLSLQQIRDELD